jgi:alpha-ketoglutarate-dependent taurine dioxygenase
MDESGTRILGKGELIVSILGNKIELPKAWRAADAGTVNDWTIPLDPDLIQSLAVESGDELDGAPDLIASCSDLFESTREQLDTGRGFVLLDRVPVESLSKQACRRVYWRIGQCLGVPVEQNIEGTMLYDVRDTGQSVGEGARFSVTNADSSFHTDAAFAEVPPEFVGLLSFCGAVSGGESQLVNAYTLHNVLIEVSPEILETLYADFSFDRRGQFHPGEPEVMVAPVFRWDGIELDTRYLHYYITEGHRAGEPLSDDQNAALAKLVEVVSRPEMRVTFSLQPGQMLFTNNHWILHNRTAFEDHPDPEKRRHYVRLWLKRCGE